MRVGQHGEEKQRAALTSMQDTGALVHGEACVLLPLDLSCLVSLAAGLTVQVPRAGSTGQFGTQSASIAIESPSQG